MLPVIGLCGLLGKRRAVPCLAHMDAWGCVQSDTVGPLLNRIRLRAFSTSLLGTDNKRRLITPPPPTLPYPQVSLCCLADFANVLPFELTASTPRYSLQPQGLAVVPSSPCKPSPGPWPHPSASRGMNLF